MYIHKCIQSIGGRRRVGERVVLVCSDKMQTDLSDGSYVESESVLGGAISLSWFRIFFPLGKSTRLLFPLLRFILKPFYSFKF